MSIAVYLAGAIRHDPNGFDYDRRWRDHAVMLIKRAFPDEDMRVISPLAFKQFDGDKWTMFNGQFLMDNNAVLQQDMASITSADLVLMNLLPFSLVYTNQFSGCLTVGEHPNIGTLTEFGIALEQRKPVIVIADSPCLTNHPFIKAGAARIVESIDDGIDYVIGMISVLLSKPALPRVLALDVNLNEKKRLDLE